MEETVDSTEIDERTEIGDILDHAGSHLANFEFLHQVLAFGGTVGLQNHAAGHDDVATALVELDDLELVLVPQQLVDVRHAPQGDLAAREERVDPHQIHDHATLDLLHQPPLNGLVGLVRGLDLLPDPHEVGLLLGQNDGAVFILQTLEKDLDLISRTHLGRLELVERNRTFRLETDIENHVRVGHAEDLALHDAALFEALHRALVEGEHPGVIFV